MLKNNTNSYIDQQQRIEIKTLASQMKNVAIQGAGLSPWESEVLVEQIEEVYFSNTALKPTKSGQVRYQCIHQSQGPGKALKECQMVTAVLTLFDPKDKGDFLSNSAKGRAAEIRRRRLTRLAEEAKEQEGYLSQEDLAELLMCDIRTIRRDIKELKAIGVVIPTRGQQKDIGPGISHRAIAIRHWLEGKEPVAVARRIQHSVAAVENYIQKFQRVAYMRGKGCDKYEIAMTAGISVYAATTLLEIYKEFKNKPFFKQRLDEISIVGRQYHQAQDEKKSWSTSLDSTNKSWSKQ